MHRSSRPARLLINFLVSTLALAAVLAIPGTADAAGGVVTFEGGGYGHGVGMPQYGAQGQALDGYSAVEIVEYYYSGASVVSLEEATAAEGSPLLEHNDSFWVGLAPDQTLIEFKAVGGPLEICQPSVGCPLANQPAAGETWELKLRSDGKCVFKHDGEQQAEPGECWAGIEMLEGARIELPSIGMSVGHGKMRIRPKYSGDDPGKFHVSFSMDLEEYLLGIAEAFNSWEPAALQAQAIASRSFAVAKAHQRETGPRSGANPGFSESWQETCWCHVRATTYDQVYAGWAQTQSASWSAAVIATEAKVLTHPDSAFTERGVISAFFSSSSAGVTETNIGGFGSTVQYPYLRSVADPWSITPEVSNPFATWTKDVSTQEIIQDLASTSYSWRVDFDDITAAQLVSGLPGSVVRFTGRVGGDQQTVDVPGWWLRSALGLRSPQIKAVSYSSTLAQLWHQDVGEIPSPLESGDRFGGVVASGDFDGDGFADLAVSAATDGINEVPQGGLVNVLYGSAGGLTSAGSQMIHEDTVGVPGVAEAGDQFGFSLASGDFNGDGYDDLAIGVPYQDNGSNTDEGSVVIVMGSQSGLNPADSHRVGPGDDPSYGVRQAGMLYGWALAAGDLDNDGKDDLVVGGPGRTISGRENAGRVQVLTKWDGSAFGSTQGRSQKSSGIPGSPGSGDQFGFALAIGDFDSDGFADVVIGAPGDTVNGAPDAGLITVLFGSDDGVTSAGAVKISQKTGGVPGAPSIGARFGEVLAAGDFNGDGRDDLAIGAPGDTVSGVAGGSVTVIHASASGFSTGTSKRLRQGGGGMPGTPEAGDRFGAALAVGDWHGDDHLDLLVGIPGEDLNGISDAGAVRLVKGSASGLRSGKGASKNQSKAGFDGTLEPGDHFGAAVGLWDLDGDGVGDWLVGVPDEDTTGFVDAGVVHIIYRGNP